jgi:hypothetical protein
MMMNWIQTKEMWEKLLNKQQRWREENVDVVLKNTSGHHTLHVL